MQETLVTVRGGINMCKWEYKNVFERYEESLDVLRRVLDKPVDAELIFWNGVCEMVNQSDMHRSAKLDCLGILLNGFVGNHDLYYELLNVFFNEMQHEECEILQKKYNFAENLNAQGDYWKQLIWDMRGSYYRDVKDWLYVFVDEVMPVVDQVIAKCENEWQDILGFTEENMENRKKKYAGYRKSLRNTYKKMESVCEVMKLMTKAPDEK